VFDMAQNHTCIASKDRTGLFDEKIFKPTIQTGEEIRAWLSGRKDIKSDTLLKSVQTAPTQPSINQKEEQREIEQLSKEMEELKPKDKILYSSDMIAPIYGICPKCGAWLLKSQSGKKLYCFMFTQQRQCKYNRDILENETLVELDKKKYITNKDAAKFYNQPIQQDLSTDIPF